MIILLSSHDRLKLLRSHTNIHAHILMPTHGQARAHTYIFKYTPAAAATVAALPLVWKGLVGAAAEATPGPATKGLVD